MDRLIRGAEAEIPPASQGVRAGCYVFAWGVRYDDSCCEQIWC